MTEKKEKQLQQSYSGRFRAAKTGVVSGIGGSFDGAGVGAGGPLSIAYRASTQDPLRLVPFEEARHPLPGVARHIVASIRADSGGDGADRAHPRRACITDLVRDFPVRRFRSRVRFAGGGLFYALSD